MSELLSQSQQAICDQFGASPDLPGAMSIVGCAATAVAGAVPINGLRHRPSGDTCGWYVWGGEELSADPDFFKPLHLAHLSQRCAEVIRFLALPAGWRFLLAPGHVDVWFDETLLTPDG